MYDRVSGKCLLLDCLGWVSIFIANDFTYIFKAPTFYYEKAVLSFHITRESRVHARHSCWLQESGNGLKFIWRSMTEPQRSSPGVGI